MAYMVSVDYTRAPIFEHSDFEAALTEAIRLSKLPQFKTANIRVLEEVVVIPRGGVNTRQEKLVVKSRDVSITLGKALDLGLL